MTGPETDSPTQYSHLQMWLRIPTSAKVKVYRQVFASAEIGSLRYWLEIFFSAGIATFGLVENSPAVIIGAMLISPLMGPIMATGLALAMGDLYLGIKAILNLVASIAVSIVFSGLIVWLLPFHSATSEILARTNPNLLDLGIALLSGLAGSVVVCRGSEEGASALPGVAIAVALMPPLCTMGFGLGSELNLNIMAGAGLLFLTNLVAIVASAFVVFLLVGIRTPDVEQAMMASRGTEQLAHVLSHGPVARMFAKGGQLHWRILMVFVLLASIAVPLRRALLQVASETLTRSAVQEVLKRLAPSDAVVSRQVSVDANDIAIHLIATRPIPESKIDLARQELMRRTGHDTQISVETVASQSQFTALMELVNRPAAAPPKETTVLELQKELLDKFRPALENIWPSADAPIQNFDVSLDSSGVTLNVEYSAPRDIGDLPIKMVAQTLQTSLALPNLTVKGQRVPPSGPSEKAKP